MTSLFKSLLVLLLTFVINFSARAQTGDLLLSHHSLTVEGLDNTNFEMVVNENGLLCIANRSGVLLYDGARWDFMATPSATLSMALDSAQNIYVGCVGNYGRIGYENNRYQFISMHNENAGKGLFFRTLVIEEQVYFMSEDQLVRHNTVDEKPLVISLPTSEEYFTNTISLGDKVVFQSSINSYVLEEGKLALFDLHTLNTSQITFSVQHPIRDEYLVGTSDNTIYNYKGSVFAEMGSSSFLKDNNVYINDGVWIDDESYAISTIENGCLIFHVGSSEPEEIIDYHKGLPDNEIFAITTDNENGLWLAHEFGLTRVENNLAIKSYSNYPGLDGNLTAVTTYKDQIYVASSHGVFYLDKENEYKNSVYYTLKKSTSSRERRKARQQNSDQQKEKDSKGGFLRPSLKKSKEDKKPVLGGIFNKKKRSQLKPTETESTANEQKKGRLGRVSLKLTANKIKDGLIKSIKGKSSKTKQYVKHVKREIVSTRYLYKALEGLNSKSKQFIHFKGKLLVAGNSGVYEISNRKATLVIPEPIRYAYVDQIGQKLMVATYGGQIQVYELVRDIWVEVEELEFPGDIIVSIHVDEQQRAWFASPSKLYRVDSFDDETDSIPEMNIANQFIDNVRLTTLNEKIYIINSLGYFYFDESEGQVVEDTELLKKAGKPLKHLAQDDGSIWVYNGKLWNHILKDGSVTGHEALGLFPDMNFINELKDKIWIINESSQFFQYDRQDQDSLISRNKMFFKDIRDQKGQVDRRGDLSFEYNNNSFEFELSRPDYLGLLKVEYQYKLSGLNKNWSAWNSNSKLDFNYLPPNKYELNVRSRDSFGNVQESTPFQFVIDPPYWQTLWFYALQILFMASMVLVSIQLNRRAKTKYVLLTEGLTILTIVLIIEFLQTVAQSYLGLQSSPVVDFMIDVSIALCVFPLEQFLKKIMRADEIGPGLSGKGLFDLISFKK